MILPDRRFEPEWSSFTRAALTCLAMIALGGCATYSGTATESRILSDLRPYTAASPALTLRAAAFASLDGLTRADAVTAMQVDGAECSGPRCVWTAVLQPAVVEIGPPGLASGAVTYTWSVTVLSELIETEDDLSTAVEQE